MATFFCKWGRPLALRVDNGEPFGSTRPSTTSELALCLIAFGVEVRANRPASPQQNGKVERQQGTSMRWAEVLQCKTLEEAQIKLDEACLIQREQYPVTRLKGKTRKEAFPQIYQNQRTWTPADFEPQRTYDFIAKKQYVRKVSANCQITHFGHKSRIGSQYAGQSVCLKLNPFTLAWEVFAANGKFIKAIQAPYLASHRINNMTVYSKN
ncbi:MAG TPA: hypothetical protein PLM41_16880 [Saprospiraceae bacterium]|jgi:hypothetical protein|nr:hypothetical protein [Saprospiraceae bacterium]